MKQQSATEQAKKAVQESREKTTCPYCPSCKSYNADANGPLLEVNANGHVHEVCPECWYRFETVTTNAP